MIKKRKRKHRKNEMKWQEMTWDGLMQRMTRARCPCHCDHRTNNYPWKITKKEVKQDEKNSVSWEMNIKFFCQTKRTSKRFLKFQQTIANPQQRLQEQRAHAKNIFVNINEKRVFHNFFKKKKFHFFWKQKDNKKDQIERSRIFCCFEWREEASAPCTTTRTLTTPSIYCQYPQFLNILVIWVNLSLHHTRQCTESVAPRQFSAHRWAAPCAKWPTRSTRLRSCLVRNFNLASFRVRFSIRAPRSFPHFIISC